VLQSGGITKAMAVIRFTLLDPINLTDRSLLDGSTTAERETDAVAWLATISFGKSSQ
jgi:hypothetical protein